MSVLRTTLWLATLLFASGLQAQSPQGQPGKGMAFSQTQPSAIKYECRSATQSRITCSFTQLDVYKVQYPSVAETLGGAWTQMDERRCAEANRELEEMRKNAPDVSQPPTGRMRSEESRIGALQATVEYCKTGSREAWRAYLTREHDRQQRTCTLSAHSYLQTFRREPVESGQPIRWITEQLPYGECKLHLEAQFTGDGVSWSYAARYAVMNKSAQQGHLKCGEIKEQEAVYASSQNEEAGWIDCETVRFEDGCYSPDFPCLGPPPVVEP